MKLKNLLSIASFITFFSISLLLGTLFTSSVFSGIFSKKIDSQTQAKIYEFLQKDRQLYREMSEKIQVVEIPDRLPIIKTYYEIREKMDNSELPEDFQYAWEKKPLCCRSKQYTPVWLCLVFLQIQVQAASTISMRRCCRVRPESRSWETHLLAQILSLLQWWIVFPHSQRHIQRYRLLGATLHLQLHQSLQTGGGTLPFALCPRRRQCSIGERRGYAAAGPWPVPWTTGVPGDHRFRRLPNYDILVFPSVASGQNYGLPKRQARPMLGEPLWWLDFGGTGLRRVALVLFPSSELCRLSWCKRQCYHQALSMPPFSIL